jgi:hypothetical protein
VNLDGEFDKPKPSLKEFTHPGGRFYLAPKEDGQTEDYDDSVQRFTEALADWRDESRAFADAKADLQAARQKLEETFAHDRQAASNENPEFDGAREFVISRSTEPLQIAISNMSRFPDGKAAWPAVVMYLADNPDELTALQQQFNTNRDAAIEELGRIKTSLKAVASGGKPAVAAAPAITTTPAPRRSPTPPKQVGGNAAPPPADLNDERLDMIAFGKLLESKYVKV